MSSLWSSFLERDSTGQAASWSSFSHSREGSSVWTSAIISSGRIYWSIIWSLITCHDIIRVQRVDGKDENIKGIQLKRMVDRIRRFQVKRGVGLEDWSILTRNTSGFEQSDICDSQQIFEDFVQWVWEHACGTCQVLPASNPPESGPVSVRAWRGWATVRNTAPWPRQQHSQGGQTTELDQGLSLNLS